MSVGLERIQLLVSVRSADEVEAALSGGADWIDVKEPSAGPLGRAALATLEEVVRQVQGRAKVSAALGELREGAAEPIALGSGPALVKWGLSGLALDAQWPKRWRKACAMLPRSVRPVAVIYADWREANAPSPDEVIEEAVQLPCAAVLIDTYHKDRGSLLRHLEHAEIERLMGKCGEAQLPVALAGSLASEDIASLLPLRPGIIAVRTAACDGGRAGTVSAARVRALADLLKRA